MHKLITYGRFHLSYHVGIRSEYDINSRRSVPNTSFSSLYLPACFSCSICCWWCAQFACNNLAKYKAWEYVRVWAWTRYVREGLHGSLCELTVVWVCLSPGAPTLSMLLELPPSLPGKPLPELPVSSVAKPPYQHLPPSTDKAGKPNLATLSTYR